MTGTSESNATSNAVPDASCASSEEQSAGGFRGKLCRIFAIDLRTLAMFRILLAALLLIDLLTRWSNLNMLYTDAGILPRDTLVQILGPSVKWTSLHYYTGASSIIQSLVFFAAAICALLLMVGCRTWLMTLLCWFLFVSLNRRLPNSASGADIILRLLLFWSLFLPLGARWSVDQALDLGKRKISNCFASVATGAILLQICYIYWFTVILKLNPDWLEGRALGHALRLDTFARPFGLWLQENESLTSVLSYGTLVVEAGAPFVALCPWFNAWARWLAILAMWGLHLGIAMCMNIGLFPYVSMLCWALFIPTESWDWLERKFGASSASLSLRGFGAWVGGFFGRVVPRRELRVRPSSLAAWIAAAAFIFVTFYNVLGLEPVNKRGLRIPRVMQLAAKVARLDQSWSMFTQPNAMDGWYAMPSKLADGSEVDIFKNGEPFSSEKPALVSASYPNFRVNRIMNNNRESAKSATFWNAYASYAVRNWNATHSPEKTVKFMQVIYFKEAVHNQPPTPQVMAEVRID